MGTTSCGANDVIMEALHKYSDMVRRICFIYLRSREDVEDVFQEVFLKLLLTKTVFESEEHQKAWICRVTINKCKDLCKSFWRKNVESSEEMQIPAEDNDESEVMLAVLSLPNKLKEVVYLYYYEGYSAGEIAKLLNQKENTVYSHLHRARKLLKSKLEGEIEYGYSV